MKKDNERLPRGITRRKDGRLVARFMLYGKSYVLYGYDIKKLEKEVAELRYEVEHGLYVKEENITVSAWFETWMETYKTNSVKGSTAEMYREAYRTEINPYIGAKKLKDIRADMVQRILNKLHDKGYSKSRVNVAYIILKGMYKQAVKNEIVGKNPVEAVTFPRFERKSEKRVMSEEEQKLFLKYASDSIYRDLYEVALSTGMRIGELLALEWDNIQFKEKMIQVRGTLKYSKENHIRYKDSPKTATSSRDIPMLDNVGVILKRRRRQQLADRMALGNKWDSTHGMDNAVFTYRDGGTFWASSIRVDMQKIEKNIRKAGIEFAHVTPHTFRHTFATRGLERGIQPKVMQMILGHSSLSMTMDLYSHVLPDTKQEEMQKLAGLF